MSLVFFLSHMFLHYCRILQHINTKRKGLEKELKELLKLCRWKRIEACLHFKNFKRTRHKHRKLIQKYTVSKSKYLIFHVKLKIHYFFRSFISQWTHFLTTDFELIWEKLFKWLKMYIGVFLFFFFCRTCFNNQWWWFLTKKLNIKEWEFSLCKVQWWSMISQRVIPKCSTMFWILWNCTMKTGLKFLPLASL